MILTNKKSINAGPSFGTGEGVAHSKRWYVALVRMHHEKKYLSIWTRWALRISFLFNRRCINGVTAAN